MFCVVYIKNMALKEIIENFENTQEPRLFEIISWFNDNKEHMLGVSSIQRYFKMGYRQASRAFTQIINIQIQDKELKEIQDDLTLSYKEMRVEEEKSIKKDDDILQSIKDKVIVGVYDDILHAIVLSENTYDYSIEEKPKGEFQTEGEFDCLDGQWVDQTTDGGYTGDEFAGTVSIKIGVNEYFQFSYWM